MEKGVFFIFDLDGVLIECNGYIQGFIATCRTLTERMGFADLAPDAGTYALFESSGVSSEWDMTAIWLAIVLETVASEGMMELIPEKLDSFFERDLKFEPARKPDFDVVVRNLRRISIPGKSIAESVYMAAREDEKYFPFMRSHPVFKELLLTTRDTRHNPVSALFEAYMVGDQAYQRITRQPARITSVSYLEKFDRTLIGEKASGLILDKQRSKDINLAVCTSRPSLAPKGMTIKGQDFFPEAEIGLHMIKLSQVPCLGWGAVKAFSAQVGGQPDNLLKPQPVQMLACLVYSLGNDAKDSLLWAYGIWNHHQNKEAKSYQSLAKPLPERISLHVFEDLTTGLQAAHGVKKILEDAHHQVDLHLWGISSHKEKVLALKAEGAKVVTHVDRAVELALKLEAMD